MQQRSSSSSSRAPDECCVINVPQQPQVKHSPRRRMDDMGGCLPLYGKTEVSRSRAAKKWVHAIPVIVLLCLFFLWWFSYPVNLVFKDDRITAIHQIERPVIPLNDTRIDLVALAVATSPIASAPLNLAGNNETEALPVSITD